MGHNTHKSIWVTDMLVSGGCHCGQIKFEADVEPGELQVCHCLDCQVLTGTAFRATVPVRPENFKLLRGKPNIYLKLADSGSRRRHAFCGNCGTPVYRMPTDNNPTYALRIGNLDQRLEFKVPAREIWVKRRLPWVNEVATATEFDGQP
jgi:hypothetical protein